MTTIHTLELDPHRTGITIGLGDIHSTQMSPIYRDNEEGRRDRIDILLAQTRERSTPMANERRKSDTEQNSRPQEHPAPEETVRERAYELYEQRGGEPGHDWDDWLQAERELKKVQGHRE